jgi:hypothetical protein
MFATPALAHSTYALMGPTMKKLEKMKTYADQVIQKKPDIGDGLLHHRPP